MTVGSSSARANAALIFSCVTHHGILSCEPNGKRSASVAKAFASVGVRNQHRHAADADEEVTSQRKRDDRPSSACARDQLRIRPRASKLEIPRLPLEPQKQCPAGSELQTKSRRPPGP
jgi:hypothetical protein